MCVCLCVFVSVCVSPAYLCMWVCMHVFVRVPVFPHSDAGQVKKELLLYELCVCVCARVQPYLMLVCVSK